MNESQNNYAERNQTTQKKEYELCHFMYLKLKKIQTNLQEQKADSSFLGREEFKRTQGNLCSDWYRHYLAYCMNNQEVGKTIRLFSESVSCSVMSDSL